MPEEKPLSLKANFPQRPQYFRFNIKFILDIVLFFLVLNQST